MDNIFQNLTEQHSRSQFLSFDYRPPKWESPIERKLWDALRYMGIGVETQVSIGAYRVDMVLFSRLSSYEVIVECDGKDYHHNLIDEFRDDELIEIAKLPIAHISGSEITESPEKCALYIIERWFPRIMETMGYATTLEMVYGEDVKLHRDGTSGFFPVGIARAITGDLYPSQSIHRYRYYLRYIVGNAPTINFLNEKERNRIEEMKIEFDKLDFPKRNFSPQELTRFYILLFYPEPQLSNELKRLDNFLENLKKINETQKANNSEML
jgi:very-short-patch-repair endonuclease